VNRARLELCSVLGLALVACSGAEIDGARAVDPSEVPRGKPLARYSPDNCKNARGEPVPAPACEVARLALGRGLEVLVEIRPGYDAVVVTNSHTEGEDRVFQFRTDDASGPDILHELRVPRAAETAAVRGRLRLSDDFEGELGDDELRPRVKTAVLDCTLVPSSASAHLDTSRALE
jgi:hypothetical protein